MTTTQDSIIAHQAAQIEDLVKASNHWMRVACDTRKLLEAEIERLTHAHEEARAFNVLHHGVIERRTKQRDQALARLAELEKRNQINQSSRTTVDNLLAQAGYAEDSSARNLLGCMNFDAAAGASHVQPSQSAEHWHSLYLKKCQELHDEKARLGAEIETLELAAIDDADRYAVQPSQAGEPVVYQSRMRPLWGQSLWTEWSNCTKGMHDDYKKTPILNDWEHEVRALSVTPQGAQQPSQAGLSDSDVWANEEIMALNAEAGLEMSLLMKIVRAAINAKGVK